MANNDGLLVEDRILHAINGKLFKDIPNNLRCMLKVLFTAINDDEEVMCKKTDDFIKPDLIISVGNKTKYLSVKSGRAENLHNEILDNFIGFLRKEGISEKTLETIMLFHYGDGTIDGTGAKRKSYIEVMLELKDRIKEANKELNCRQDFVQKVMYHCALQGTKRDNPIIDAIYFGNEEFGFTTTKKQILMYIRMRSFSFYDNLHVGPLLMRPHSRYVGRSIADERNRNRIIIYWPKLNADLDYISKRYNY